MNETIQEKNKRSWLEAFRHIVFNKRETMRPPLKSIGRLTIIPAHRATSNQVPRRIVHLIPKLTPTRRTEQSAHRRKGANTSSVQRAALREPSPCCLGRCRDMPRSRERPSCRTLDCFTRRGRPKANRRAAPADVPATACKTA